MDWGLWFVIAWFVFMVLAAAFSQKKEPKKEPEKNWPLSRECKVRLFAAMGYVALAVLYMCGVFVFAVVAVGNHTLNPPGFGFAIMIGACLVFHVSFCVSLFVLREKGIMTRPAITLFSLLLGSAMFVISFVFALKRGCDPIFSDEDSLDFSQDTESKIFLIIIAELCGITAVALSANVIDMTLLQEQPRDSIYRPTIREAGGDIRTHKD